MKRIPFHLLIRRHSLDVDHRMMMMMEQSKKLHED
jgi:hypothetical protein